MEKFKQDLVNVINNTTLPPECIYFVIKDIYRDVLEQYKEVQKQIAAGQVASTQQLFGGTLHQLKDGAQLEKFNKLISNEQFSQNAQKE